MEESLKARLIGAAVLVALAVLLIPELLSGRKAAEPAVDGGVAPRGTRTFTIELGQGPGQGQGATSHESTPVAAAPAIQAPAAAPVEPAAEPAAEPAPETVAAAPPAAVDSDATPAVVTPEPPRAAAAEPKTPPTASPSPGAGWVVQVGAFGSVATARKLASDLNGAGYRAFVSPVTKGGKTLYRVRVGPEPDKAGAEKHVQRLKSRGLPTAIVQND